MGNCQLFQVNVRLDVGVSVEEHDAGVIAVLCLLTEDVVGRHGGELALVVQNEVVDVAGDDHVKVDVENYFVDFIFS